MQICTALISAVLLLSLQAQPAAPQPVWEEVVESICAEEPAAAERLLDWAAEGEAAETSQVWALLEETRADPIRTAVAFGDALDAADILRDTGEKSVDTERYRAAVRSLSPLFTRLLEADTTPYEEELSDYPTDLAAFDGIWCDGELGEMLIFRDGRCRVVIPYLDYYGEAACEARLRDRSAVGYCPSLEVDIHETGSFSGPLTYYVSGLAEDHFWSNTQRQRFDRMA